MSEIEETKERLKEQWRSIHTGGCKIISIGDNCQCHLCLIDKLYSSFETRGNEIKALEGLRMSLRDEVTGLEASLEKEKEGHIDTINQLEEAAGKHLNNLMEISTLRVDLEKKRKRVGQLENAIDEWTKLYHSLQEHTDKLGGIISDQTEKRLELEERAKELEPDALYLRKYREIRGKNPEIPCACVIDEDGQWIKKCGFHATIVEGLEEKVKELDDRIVELVLIIDEYAGRIIKAETGRMSTS